MSKLIRQSIRKDIEPLKDYLEFLVWKDKNRNQPAKNPVARKIIKAMKEPPHLTEEDISALLQVIDEGKQPTRFESPFDGIDELEKQ